MGRRRLRDQSSGDDEQGDESNSSSAHGGLRVRSGYAVQLGKIRGKWQGGEHYSARSTPAGSTLPALLAGRNAATAPTTISRTGAAMNVIGSAAPTP